MIGKDLELRCRVLITFQVALLGMVTRQLRGVTVGWDESGIWGYLCFDGEVSNEEHEMCSDIQGEIAASFPITRSA